MHLGVEALTQRTGTARMGAALILRSARKASPEAPARTARTARTAGACPTPIPAPAPAPTPTLTPWHAEPQIYQAAPNAEPLSVAAVEELRNKRCRCRPTRKLTQQSTIGLRGRRTCGTTDTSRQGAGELYYRGIKRPRVFNKFSHFWQQGTRRKQKTVTQTKKCKGCGWGVRCAEAVSVLRGQSSAVGSFER
jgi:hypothetical protein